MRTYFNADKTGYAVVFGNGTKKTLGWPIDFLITSYGWVNIKGTYKDGTYLWADSYIEIFGIRFTWQIWFDKGNKLPHIEFQLERAR